MKSINFFVVSNNQYFILGLKEYVASLYHADVSSHSGWKIKFKSYQSHEALNIYNDLNLKNKTSAKNNVIIADNEMYYVLALFLKKDISPSVIFLTSTECDVEYLKRIRLSLLPEGCFYNALPSFSRIGGLNHREKRVCFYIYQGLTPTMIGLFMGVHSKSVSNYRKSIKKKIGCQNKGEFNNALIKYYKLCRC